MASFKYSYFPSDHYDVSLSLLTSRGSSKFLLYFPLKVRTLLPQIWCVQNLRTFYLSTPKGKLSVCHPLRIACFSGLSTTWPAYPLLGWADPNDFSLSPFLTPLSCLALTRADHYHLKGCEHSCWHMTFTAAASAPPPPSSQRTLARRGGEAAPICTLAPTSKDWGTVILAHLYPILGATSAGNLGSKWPDARWSFPHCQITTSPVHMTLRK